MVWYGVGAASELADKGIEYAIHKSYSWDLLQAGSLNVFTITVSEMRDTIHDTHAVVYGTTLDAQLAGSEYVHYNATWQQWYFQIASWYAPNADGLKLIVETRKLTQLFDIFAGVLLLFVLLCCVC